MGSLPEVWRDPLTLFESGRRRYGDTVGYRFGPYRYTMIHRTQDIRRVLVHNHASYPKSPTYQGLKLLLGNGLVTSDGAFWRRQRKLAQPAFHHRALVGLSEAMLACTEDTVSEWSAKGDAFELDLHAEMMALTLRIVGHTLFSTELGGTAHAIGDAMEVCLEHANHAAESMMLIPQWVPTARNLAFRRNKAILDEVVNGIIAERRRAAAQGAEPTPDLLGMLMAATDETGSERMTDAQLRDEIMTLVLAGHETTANALSWTFVLLARHPEVARRLRTELDAVLGGRAPTVEDLGALAYTGQVLDEAMRVYPPVWIFERQAAEADELGGHPIEAGTIVAVSPWTLHRHPGLWRSPTVFDPERFSEAEVAKRDRFSYLPFGAGPRVCIGNAFAKMEAKLLLARLCSRFDFELVDETAIVPEPGVTLRPKHGVPARVRPRR